MKANCARPFACFVAAAALVIGSCSVGTNTSAPAGGASGAADAKADAPTTKANDEKSAAASVVDAQAGADKTGTAAKAAEPMPAHDANDAKEEKAAEPAKAAPEPNSCISSRCHTTILSKKNVHDAAEGCTDCHEEVSTPHPAKGVKTFKLLNDMPDLCSTCHDEYGKKKTVHSPVEDGSCTECHDPHSSAEPKLMKKPVGQVCKDCHEDPTSQPNLHSPVEDGDCTSCHDPHETDTKALLVKEMPGLCVECHESMADTLKQKIVHGPVGDGDCTECHDPHGSKQASLLTEEPKTLCISCHETVGDEIKNAKVSHDAMDDDKGCLLCHSAHASDHEALLEKLARQTCLECHDATVTADAKVLHGKNNDGSCVACHTPHSGERSALLAADFPEGKYQRYNDQAYPLCFKCHERGMVAEKETSSATGFRDGKKNLHFAHVNNPDKSRSCAICHSVHGTNNPALLNDSVEFGKWKMQLKFVKTETGGGCAPGCHKPLFYDRDSPGRKPPSAPGTFDKGA